MAVEIELTRDRQIEQLFREIGHVVDDAPPGTEKNPANGVRSLGYRKPIASA